MQLTRPVYYRNLLLLFLSALPFIALTQNNFDYGIKATLNYTTIGSRYTKYTGIGQYSLGIFGTYQVAPSIALAFEPMFTQNSFRETQSDNRYKYSYFDANINMYVNLFHNDALRLFLGVRPGFLTGYRSEVFKNGSFEKADNPFNKNKKNQLDMGINTGLSLRVSQVITFEVGYLWSMANQTDLSQVKGRPSTLEVSLKLNAVDLKNVLSNKEESVIRKVKHYKQGALLVMLPTLTEKELARIKNENDRIFVANELRLRNLKVIQEFRKYYSFTPVYFFMDSNVQQVINGNIAGIFVNDNMVNDPAIMPATPDNYFVASFCYDLSDYNQKVSYGLFIYDNKMVQLEKPFNVAGQLFGLFSDGDPANYFRYKRPNYTAMPFDRMIKKFNGRMIRYSTIE